MFNHALTRYLFYAGMALVFFLAIFVICFFCTSEGLFYSACWGILAAGYALVATRVGFHLIMKDTSAEMWQVAIYQSIAVTGWLVAVLANSWTLTSIGMAMIAGFTMMTLGTRFIRYKGDWLKAYVEKDISTLEETCRWKFINDDYNAGEDTERPLCAVNGSPLTVSEARAQGYVNEAEEGSEYLRKLVEEER